MIEKEVKICNMTFCPDTEKIWILKIPSLTYNCEEILTETTSKLGPHAKRSFARRIETDNPKVEAFLKTIGLRSPTDKSP